MGGRGAGAGPGGVSVERTEQEWRWYHGTKAAVAVGLALVIALPMGAPSAPTVREETPVVDAPRDPEQEILTGTPEDPAMMPLPQHTLTLESHGPGRLTLVGPNTFSGSGKPGSTVRLHIDSKVVAEVRVGSDGKWSTDFTLAAKGDIQVYLSSPPLANKDAEETFPITLEVE
jgi:hypothetical protein